MAAESSFVTVQKRGTIALPSRLRRRYGLDQPGAQVELLEREDGVIELRPKIAVPADQAWFWTERWQAREREVDELVEAGDEKVHDSVDDLLTHAERVREG